MIDELEQKGISRTHRAIGSKDAFHVAAVLVMAEHWVTPGMNVKFVDNDYNQVCKCQPEERHGVVDPFLVNEVKRGEKFWILLNPDLVTKLHHSFEIGLEELPTLRECEIKGCD